MAIRERSGGGITLLVLDEAALNRLFDDGGVANRWMRKIARDVQKTAEENLVRAGGVKKGKLLESIGHSVTPTHRRLVANVRAGAGHALMYHEGTEAHEIWAKNGRGLRFFWDRAMVPRSSPGGNVGGGWVILGKVDHPGWKGNPFLREAMESTLLRRGIGV